MNEKELKRAYESEMKRRAYQVDTLKLDAGVISAGHLPQQRFLKDDSTRLQAARLYTLAQHLKLSAYSYGVRFGKNSAGNGVLGG